MTMGLFSKKECSVCGGDAGRVFVKKLEDGILCKECTGKLSPWFTGRRHATVADIEAQLAYREANKAEVARLNPTRTLGSDVKVYIDEAQGKFIVTSDSGWRNSNPDVINITDVTGVNLETTENRYEETWTDDEGNTKSYNPPRWHVDRDYYAEINVNTTYFDEIRIQLNSYSVDGHDHAAAETYARMGQELKDELLGQRKAAYDNAAAAAAPKTAVTCRHCNATTILDENGCCEYCGGANV